MSTNPFDEAPYGPSGGAPGGGVRPKAKAPQWPERRQRDEGDSSHAYNTSTGSTQQQQIRDPTGATANEPIWTVRGVEWPIPPSLSAGAYSRLSRASRLAGSVLGISSASDDDSGGIKGSAGEGEGGGGRGGKDGSRREAASSGDISGPLDTAAAAEKGGYIAGLMERVWTGSSVADGGRIGASQFISISLRLHIYSRFASMAFPAQTAVM